MWSRTDTRDVRDRLSAILARGTECGDREGGAWPPLFVEVSPSEGAAGEGETTSPEDAGYARAPEGPLTRPPATTSPTSPPAPITPSLPYVPRS